MGFLLDIPPIECYVRAEYLYQGDESKIGEYYECTIIGVKSWQHHALYFVAHICRTQSLYDKLPISAFCYEKDSIHMDFDLLQLWDCFSYHIDFVQYSFLKGKKAVVFAKDKKQYEGLYLFTLDWAQKGETNLAEVPAQSKCAHIIQLDNGNYAAQPNNRVYFLNPDDGVDLANIPTPDYKVTEKQWHCESHKKWHTDPSDNHFYGVEYSSDSELKKNTVFKNYQSFASTFPFNLEHVLENNNSRITKHAAKDLLLQHFRIGIDFVEVMSIANKREIVILTSDTAKKFIAILQNLGYCE